MSTTHRVLMLLVASIGHSFFSLKFNLYYVESDSGYIISVLHLYYLVTINKIIAQFRGKKLQLNYLMYLIR